MDNEASIIKKEVDALAKEYKEIQVALEYGTNSENNNLSMMELEKELNKKIVDLCKRLIDINNKDEPISENERRRQFNDLYNRIKDKLKITIFEDIGKISKDNILPTLVDRQIEISSIKKPKTIILSKISGIPLAQLPPDSLIKKSNGFDRTLTVELKIPKKIFDIYKKEMVENPIIEDIKNERLIEIDEEEVYHIKNIVYENDNFVTITAKSREIRLSSIDIELENCFITFFTKNKDREHYILNDLLFEQTGWKLGTVTDIVKYDPNTNHERYIWIEGATKKWSEFIKTDICERLECECYFDSKNKKVHLYKENEMSHHIGLYLSKDNYIKSLEKTFDSEKIVTRLKVEGNGEYTVADAMCTGSPFMENYLYFIQNREMSDELIEALTKYYSMVKKREPNWKTLVEKKIEKERERDKLSYEFRNNQAMVTAQERTYDMYHNPIGKDLKEDDIRKRDMVREAELLAEITKLNHKINDNKRDIKLLEEEIDGLKKSIDNIVSLCQKKTCTDDDGQLIFNEKLLSELQDFTYTEPYKNESFLPENAYELINLAKKKLREMAFPTKEWNIEVENFKERVIPNYLFDWNGNLSLGDIVILYDRDLDREEYCYFVGYEIEYQDKNITISLSNKRGKQEASGFIADQLTNAKNAMRTIEAKMYLLNEQKYKMLNVPDYIIPKNNKVKPKRPDGTTIN